MSQVPKKRKYDYRRRALYLGYQENEKYPVYIDDMSSNSSPYFNISGLDKPLTSGKNLFKINPPPGLLQVGSQVFVEIADEYGNAIFTRVTGMVEDDRHLITAWVYDDFPSDKAFITVLGTAIQDYNGDPIVGTAPDGLPWWDGRTTINYRTTVSKPNIRWRKQIEVDKYAPNDSKILFEYMPRVRIEEHVQTYFSQSYVGPQITSSVISMSYSNVGMSSYLPGRDTDGSAQINFQPQIETTNPFFSSSMEGATVKFNGDHINGRGGGLKGRITENMLKGFGQPGFTGFDYEATIMHVPTSRKAILSTPYAVIKTESIQLIADRVLPNQQASQIVETEVLFDHFHSSAMQITHSNPPFYSSTHNSESFAVIDVQNMNPLSGDVDKIVTKIRRAGSMDKFEVIGEEELEASELLTSSASFAGVGPPGPERWGEFIHSGSFSFFWDLENYNAAGSVTTNGADFLAGIEESNDEYLINGLKIIKTLNDHGARIVSKEGIDLFQGTVYTLKFNVVGETNKDSAYANYRDFNFYAFISGSAVRGMVGDKNLHGPFDPDNIFVDSESPAEDMGANGLLIAQITGSNVREQWVAEYSFLAANTGYAQIAFVLEKGSAAYINDISIKADQQTGFTPEQFQHVFHIPTTHNDDQIDFKLELYNPQNIKSNVELQYNAVDFRGGNQYIHEGLVAGALAVGENMEAAGFEFKGDASAYLRTVNPTYPGFTSASAGSGSGILMWSGSLGGGAGQGLGSLAPYTGSEGIVDDVDFGYRGLGFEIVNDSSSFFRFRTDPQRLDIRTDSFFLGGDSAYISGALGQIEITSSNFFLDNQGNISMSGQITAEAGGTIGGWTITSESIESIHDSIGVFAGIQIKSGEDSASIRIGRLPYGSSYTDYAPYIEMFNNDSDDSLGIRGYVADGNNATIKSEAFFLGRDATTGTRGGGRIAGWTFDSESISGGSMIIRKDGTIMSDGFVSNLAGSGFMLTAAQGGMLEVENARIRGTLSTAVFEKETINAVGGQLWVANSTTLTSSTDHPSAAYSASETTFSVVNASGFTGSYTTGVGNAGYGEILTIKKVTDTGFSTEYVLVQSMSRTPNAEDNDLTGKLYVVRGYSGAEPVAATAAGEGINSTGSIGAGIGVPQEYSGSQVIVSTGRIGTGYVRINANPSDVTTPYIDIIERTGSAVYDVDLKARIGDLSGINDTRFSDGVNGFGIYTENGYFKGKIEVASLPTPPPTDGLILHYPLQQQFLGATGLPRIADFSGNGLHSRNSLEGLPDNTLFNVGAGSGPTGGSLGFDGNSSVVRTRDGITASLANSFTASDQTITKQDYTVAYWAKPEILLEEVSGSAKRNTSFHFTNAGDNTFAFFHQYGAELQYGYQPYFSGSATYISTSVNDGVTVETIVSEPSQSNPYISASYGRHHLIVNETKMGEIQIDTGSLQTKNTWRHYAIVAPQDQSASLWIDGQRQGYFTASLVNHISMSEVDQLMLGADQDTNLDAANSNDFFTGSMADFRLYSKALTEKEIESLYVANNPPGRTVIDGSRITTGQIQSSNWGSSAGSQLNLDAGTITLGGSSSPLFSVNEEGHVSASAGMIAGFSLTQQAYGSGVMRSLESMDGNFQIITRAGSALNSGNAEMRIGDANQSIHIRQGSAFEGILATGTFDPNADLTFFGQNNAGVTAAIMKLSGDIDGNNNPGIVMEDGGYFTILGPVDPGNAQAIVDIKQFNAAPIGDAGTTGKRACGYFAIADNDTIPANYTEVVPDKTSTNPGAGSSGTDEQTLVAVTAFAHAESGPASGYRDAIGILSKATVSAAQTNQGANAYSFMGAEGQLFNEDDILCKGEVYAYYQVSDQRAKENVVGIENALDKIKQIRGVEFEWNENGPKWATMDYFGSPEGNHKDVGVIAQEVQKVFPRATKEKKDGYLQVAYNKLVPLLIEGMKEQQNTIEELQSRLEKLEKTQCQCRMK